MGDQRKTVRCAVYTRKSSEEGLEQSFNSLHARERPVKPTSKARSTKAGRLSGPNTTMVASRVARWSGPL
jgi:hypothetical protein